MPLLGSARSAASPVRAAALFWPASGPRLHRDRKRRRRTRNGRTKRRKVPWPGSATSRNDSPCPPLPVSASRLAAQPQSLVLNPRPDHPLPPHGTDLPHLAPAQDQAMLFPPSHHPPEAPLHHPKGAFGKRMRQRKIPVQLGLTTRIRAREGLVMGRRPQQPPHQHPHLRPLPSLLHPRRSNPQQRTLQILLSGPHPQLHLHLPQ